MTDSPDIERLDPGADLTERLHPGVDPEDVAFLFDFAACPPEGPDFDYARHNTHDQVRAHLARLQLVQVGPVTWSTAPAEAAADLLAKAGVTEARSQGLREFLAKTPGTVLLVTSVPYTLPPNRRS